MQSHRITLSFHREMADSSGELGGPDITAAVRFESYPRFIKGGFENYEGLGIKRSTAEWAVPGSLTRGNVAHAWNHDAGHQRGSRLDLLPLP